MKNLKRFKGLVEKEARLLKENATVEELSKLNFDTLDADHRGHCIYGQMTGNCDSYRSLELMKDTCIDRVMKRGSFGINGSLTSDLYVKKGLLDEYYREFFSPIEIWITTDFNFGEGSPKRVKKLIDYLQDTTGTVTFKA